MPRLMGDEVGKSVAGKRRIAVFATQFTRNALCSRYMLNQRAQPVLTKAQKPEISTGHTLPVYERCGVVGTRIWLRF